MAEETGDTMVFTHTQSDIDNAVSSRLARATATHTTALSEKDTSILELTAQIESMKANVEQGEQKKLTATEHTQALEKRIQQMEDNEVANTLKLKEQSDAKVVSDINSIDKDSIAKAGFDPKFSDMVLTELHKSRTMENGVAFYKDGEGAQIEQSSVLESLKAQYPEFITINRAGGNNVPTAKSGPDVDPAKESTSAYIDRMNLERAEARK